MYYKKAKQQKPNPQSHHKNRWHEHHSSILHHHSASHLPINDTCTSAKPKPIIISLLPPHDFQNTHSSRISWRNSVLQRCRKWPHQCRRRGCTQELSCSCSGRICTAGKPWWSSLPWCRDDRVWARWRLPAGLRWRELRGIGRRGPAAIASLVSSRGPRRRLRSGRGRAMLRRKGKCKSVTYWTKFKDTLKL